MKKAGEKKICMENTETGLLAAGHDTRSFWCRPMNSSCSHVASDDRLYAVRWPIPRWRPTVMSKATSKGESKAGSKTAKVARPRRGRR